MTQVRLWLKRNAWHICTSTKNIIKSNTERLMPTLGVDPAKWGPYAWMALHRLSFQLSASDGREFFEALGHVIPCQQCRTNYAQHMKHHAFNGRNIPKWLYVLHERVNKFTGKTAVSPTYGEVREKYLNAPMDEDELKFLAAVLRTHPGQHKATEQYMQALSTVIRIWCNYSGISDVPKNYSRASLSTWLKTLACRGSC